MLIMLINSCTHISPIDLHVYCFTQQYAVRYCDHTTTMILPVKKTTLYYQTRESLNFQYTQHDDFYVSHNVVCYSQITY